MAFLTQLFSVDLFCYVIILLGGILPSLDVRIYAETACVSSVLSFALAKCFGDVHYEVLD